MSLSSIIVCRPSHGMLLHLFLPSARVFLRSYFPSSSVLSNLNLETVYSSFASTFLSFHYSRLFVIHLTVRFCVMSKRIHIFFRIFLNIILSFSNLSNFLFPDHSLSSSFLHFSSDPQFMSF